MNESYEAPFFEVLKFTDDVLMNSKENNSMEANEFEGFQDDYTDWVF